MIASKLRLFSQDNFGPPIARSKSWMSCISGHSVRRPHRG
jgi:hypothetical protein